MSRASRCKTEWSPYDLHPGADDATVRQIFAERMRIARRLDDRNIYRVAEESP